MRPLDLALPCLALLAADLGAAVWIGGDAADWNHPDNWEGGAMPGEHDPVWEIPEGVAVTLAGVAPGGEIVKRGGGLLHVGPGLAPDTVILAEAGRVTWAEPIKLAHLRLAGGRAEGQGLVVDFLAITSGVAEDLATLPGLEAGMLRLEGSGTLRWHPSVRARNLDVAGGQLDFGDERVRSEAYLIGGALVGGVLEGTLIASGGILAARFEGTLILMGGAIEAAGASVGGEAILAETTLTGSIGFEGAVWMATWGGSSRIEGTATLHPGSTLNWWLDDPWTPAPLVVTGELSATEEVSVGLGLVDWSHPYWDEAREFLLVDAWEGGIVNAVFSPDPAAGGGEGAWEPFRAADGDLVMRWAPAASAAGAAVVPEPSGLGAISALAALATAISARRRRAGPR